MKPERNVKLNGYFAALHRCTHGANRTERGAVMAEYGLLIAVLFLGVAASIGIFHDELIDFFSDAAGTISNEGA